MVLEALAISLKVSVLATVATFAVGIAAARMLTKNSFKFKGIIEAFIIIPMFLPPSVVGYLLLLLIGKNGFIGKIIYKYFQQGLIFTWQAGVLAAFVVSLPLMYQSTKAAFLSIDPIYEEAAKVMGASSFQIFWKIIIPLCIKGIISGIILAFGRAFGEFGATLMVAGNIQGKTQTITTAIYYAVESGDKASANVLLLLVLAISFTMIFVFNHILKSTTTY